MLLGARGQDYFVDTVAFTLSLLLFVPVAALIVASLLEEPLKAHAAARAKRAKRTESLMLSRFAGAHWILNHGSLHRLRCVGRVLRRPDGRQTNDGGCQSRRHGGARVTCSSSRGA